MNGWITRRPGQRRTALFVLALGSVIAAAQTSPSAANPYPARPAATRRPSLGFPFAAQLSPESPPFYRDYHDFSGSGADGNGPVSELVADSKGNLYGTTEMGGTSGNGTIYRMKLPASMAGTAAYTTLHSFKPGEGATPEGAVLIGSDGGYYGTTNAGGAHGDGTVYRYDPVTFKLKTLHSFNPAAGDGSNPSGGLTVGPGGLLYGTTDLGGAYGVGTVFAISPMGGSVSYATIHTFGAPGDGARPYQGRLVSSGSYLFGMTISDTMNGYGTAYELVQSGTTWSESVIKQFGTVTGDAFEPSNGLVIDSAGNLYGCAQGGHYASGAVFALAPLGAGAYSFTVIESFGAHSGDPSVASCALVLGETGHLIGTSSNGGQYGAGTVFRLTQSGAGWALATRFSFGPVSGGNAYDPVSPLLAVGNGYYVGTAFSGGQFGYGAVYEIKP